MRGENAGGMNAVGSFSSPLIFFAIAPEDENTGE